MSKIIAVANQKGGVGKTTTAFNLSYNLKERGYKVLMVDFDPQSNLTMSFGEAHPEDLEKTIFHLMMEYIDEKDIEIRDYVLSKNGLNLIPSSIEMSAMEINLVNTMSRELILKGLIEPLKEEYDYIIIDCMPSLGMLTINALAAADSVLITATPQFLSAKGLELLLQSILRVKKRINSNLQIDGILITMHNQRTNLSKEIIKMISETYSEYIKIYSTKIPTSVKVGEAAYKSCSVGEHDANNKVAIAYKEFTEEYCNEG